MIHIFSEGLLSNAHFKLKQKLISHRILNRFFLTLLVLWKQITIKHRDLLLLLFLLLLYVFERKLEIGSIYAVFFEKTKNNSLTDRSSLCGDTFNIRLGKIVKMQKKNKQK